MMRMRTRTRRVMWRDAVRVGVMEMMKTMLSSATKGDKSQDSKQKKYRTVLESDCFFVFPYRPFSKDIWCFIDTNMNDIDFWV